MEAKELRLGNYVKFPNNEKPLMVNHRIIHDLFHGTTIYNPILLTEEWFLNFSFVKVRDYPCFRLDGIQIEYHGSSSEWKCDLFSGRTSIKFVHQLQNLFFALAGKELYLPEN